MNQFVNADNMEAALQVCLSVPAVPLQAKYYSASSARAICEYGAAHNLSLDQSKHLMVLFKESVWAQIFTTEFLLSAGANANAGSGAGPGANARFDSGIDDGSCAHAGSGVKARSCSGSGSDGGSDSDSGAKARAGSGAKARAGSGAKARAGSGSGSSSDDGSGAKARAGSGSGSGSGSGFNASSVAVAGSDADARATVYASNLAAIGVDGAFTPSSMHAAYSGTTDQQQVKYFVAREMLKCYRIFICFQKMSTKGNTLRLSIENFCL